MQIVTAPIPKIMNKLNTAQKAYLKEHLTKKVTREKYKQIQETIKSMSNE